MYTLFLVHPRRAIQATNIKMKYSKFIQHDRSNIRYSFIRYIQDHKSLCYAFAKKHQSIFSHQHVQSRAFDLLDQTSEKRRPVVLLCLFDKTQNKFMCNLLQLFSSCKICMLQILLPRGNPNRANMNRIAGTESVLRFQTVILGVLVLHDI